MRISNLKPGFCAAALILGVISIHAEDDNPAQAAARAALEQRIQQANGATNEPPPMPAPAPAPQPPAEVKQMPPPPTPPPPPAPAPAPAMTSAPEPMAAPASASYASEDTPSQAAARAALIKRMNETQSGDAAMAQPIVIITNSPGTMTASEKKAIAKANAEADAKKEASDSAAMPVAKPAPKPAMGMEIRPASVPPLPISAEKQAQLNALLAAYMADKISPEEYHKQRAAILAQP